MKEFYKKLIHGKELILDEASMIRDVSEINNEFPIKYIFERDIYLGFEKHIVKKSIVPILIHSMHLVTKLKKS